MVRVSKISCDPFSVQGMIVSRSTHHRDVGQRDLNEPT